MTPPRPFAGLLAGLLLAALIVMLLTGQLWLLFAGASVAAVTWWRLGAEGAR